MRSGKPTAPDENIYAFIDSTYARAAEQAEVGIAARSIATAWGRRPPVLEALTLGFPPFPSLNQPVASDI